MSFWKQINDPSNVFEILQELRHGTFGNSLALSLYVHSLYNVTPLTTVPRFTNHGGMTIIMRVEDNSEWTAIRLYDVKRG